jgi:hypothetical protein
MKTATSSNLDGLPLGRSTAEGAGKERGEEVLGLTQRLALHRAQPLNSLYQCRELLL